MARNQVLSGNFVLAITVPDVNDQRRLHNVQPMRRPDT
jgi:hypothetical protein